MEIGLLGGTFDPIHLGHLIIAEEVRLKLGLSKVIFIPAGQPWLKADREITLGEHRLEMVRRAIESAPHFEASAVEIKRGGRSYSVDTVAGLRNELDPLLLTTSLSIIPSTPDPLVVLLSSLALHPCRRFPHVAHPVPLNACS